MPTTRQEWMKAMDQPKDEPDPLVEFGGLALDAVHKARQELLAERQVSRFLAETLATEGKWTTEQWLDQARLAVEGMEDEA